MLDRSLLLSLAAGAALAAHFGLWLPSLNLTCLALVVRAERNP